MDFQPLPRFSLNNVGRLLPEPNNSFFALVEIGEYVISIWCVILDSIMLLLFSQAQIANSRCTSAIKTRWGYPMESSTRPRKMSTRLSLSPVVSCVVPSAGHFSSSKFGSSFSFPLDPDMVRGQGCPSRSNCERRQLLKTGVNSPPDSQC